MTNSNDNGNSTKEIESIIDWLDNVVAHDTECQESFQTIFDILDCFRNTIKEDNALYPKVIDLDDEIINLVSVIVKALCSSITYR